MVTFKDFPLKNGIQKALDSMGFTKPTEIQEKAIPVLIESKKIDFHGQAQTGTGKTLAFGIPLIQKIDASSNNVQALVVAPTRELVLQITKSLQEVSKFTDVVVHPVYGGVSMQDQIRALKKGVHIVVGTPGRLNDHLRRKTMKLNKLQALVLDEADIMLDMGFREEVDAILVHTPSDRQVWLFSATVKDGIRAIQKDHMKDPISVRVSAKNVGSSQVDHFFSVVPRKHRFTALMRFVDSLPHFYGFIFCPTKILTSEVAERLLKRGYRTGALHGDMNQAQRNRVIKRFKEKRFDILVATDVAARGIDVPDATHVLNYALPDDHESYVHRVGRTGRAGKKGEAISFIAPSQMRYIRMLEKKFNMTIKPIDVPKLEDIINVRVAEAAEYLSTASHKSSKNGSTKLGELVAEYSHEELTNAVVTLLHEKFLTSVKPDEDITFVSAKEINKNSSSMNHMYEELFLSIGSDDGLKNRELYSMLERMCKVKKNQLQKAKIIKRRTFITVPSAMVSKVISSLQGYRYKGRRVRVMTTGE